MRSVSRRATRLSSAWKAIELCRRGRLTALIDTNVLVRHLTGDPPEMAARATAYLGPARQLLLTDLIAAETVYVLESCYQAPRGQVCRSAEIAHRIRLHCLR